MWGAQGDSESISAQIRSLWTGSAALVCPHHIRLVRHHCNGWTARFALIKQRESEGTTPP